MYDPKAPSSVLAIAELHKPGTFDLLRRMAMAKARHEQEADDFVSHSLDRVLDPEDMPWIPIIRVFLLHMRDVIRRVSYRVNRRKSAHAEISDGGAAQENAGSDERVDEDIDDKRAHATRKMLGGRLLDRMKDDADARVYFELVQTRDLEPSEIAAALTWTVDKVHLVRKRFVYHAQAIHQEWQDGEARRMKALREQATTESKGEAP